MQLPNTVDLVASWSAPSRASYRADVFGADKQPISLRLSNVGRHSVDVRRVSVAFTATREGVSFACDGRVGAMSTAHEPAMLAPGESFVFRRQIDCAMPLPGHYDVGVYVVVNGASSSELGDFVGAFGLDVIATKTAPILFPDRPGLYVMMSGAESTRPLPPEAWARGDYHVVLAFVNGAKKTAPLGAGQLAFLTYRRGSSLACSGQEEHVALPDALGPGAVHIVRAPVTCAPSEEGIYEIVGRFRFFGDAGGIEVGRVSLRVTQSPSLYIPEPPNNCIDCPRQWLK